MLPPSKHYYFLFLHLHCILTTTLWNIFLLNFCSPLSLLTKHLTTSCCISQSAALTPLPEYKTYPWECVPCLPHQSPNSMDNLCNLLPSKEIPLPPDTCCPPLPILQACSFCNSLVHYSILMNHLPFQLQAMQIMYFHSFPSNPPEIQPVFPEEASDVHFQSGA